MQQSRWPRIFALSALLVVSTSSCTKSAPQKTTVASVDSQASGSAVAQTPDTEVVAPAVVTPAVGSKAPATAAPPADEINARLKAAAALLKDEAIGELRLAMTAKAVIAILGPPADKGESWKEAGTGETASQWEWKTGIDVYFSNAPGKAPKVRGITVNAQSALKTKKGIGIGSSRTEIDAAYGAGKMQLSAEDEAFSYIVGDPTDGMTFTLSNGKVSEMYWGIKGY